MYTITSTIYTNYADQILDRLTCNNSFFSGALTVETEQASIADPDIAEVTTHTLRTTIIVYREPYNPILRERETGFDGAIRDIAAVWWEHETQLDDGSIVEDNFDFELLKKRIMEL